MIDYKEQVLIANVKANIQYSITHVLQNCKSFKPISQHRNKLSTNRII